MYSSDVTWDVLIEVSSKLTQAQNKRGIGVERRTDQLGVKVFDSQ